MINEVINEFQSNCRKVTENLQKELSRIRTGRATPSLLDNVRVDYYGSPTPLKQLATIAVADPRLLTVAPFDKGQLTDVERAIQASGLGLTPNNDGKIIRIPIPALTGERRKDLVKQIKKIGEDYKVTVRNFRHEANDLLKEAKEEKEISEDDMHRGLKRVQDATNDQIKLVDDIIEEKEKEIMDF